MYKKVVSLFLLPTLLVGGALNLTACNSDNKSEFDYNSLYTVTRTEPYAIAKSGEDNASRYGYTNMSEQGYNGWYYLYKSADGYYQMTCSQSGEWSGGGARISGATLFPTEKTGAVRSFKVSAAGEITVYGNFKCANKLAAGAQINVYLNDEKIYGESLSKGDVEGVYFEVNAEVSVGDELFIEALGEKAEVVLDPVVSYRQSQNSSLYHLTTFGKYYGDVFPFYDDEAERLYMGFLWNDNAATNSYENALEISDNMLTYTNVPEANNYDVWQYYKQNGRLHYIYDPNKYVDNSIYPAGVRDNMIYFDEDNDRYLMVGGCYYRFDASAQTSDLVIYASDDAMGFSWTKPGTVVEAGYSKNLPECPQLLKIGNRWYVFVSVAYNTAHQVGPLQYWTGDENVDCLNVDWQSKNFSFLDGEDLCAARPIKVKNKVYMWGWIPRTYDTMPWAPWAGYLNLPREVVQLSDGSLGGRLDPALTALLNYGNIYTLQSGNYNVISGNTSFENQTLKADGETLIFMGEGFNRNLITFTADIQNSKSCGYVMKQNGKTYMAIIVKEDEKTYLKVLSPDDDTHKVNSVIEIKDSNNGKFDVKIVCDGEFIEFFVNDEYALTAHTAMTGPSYEAYLYSSNGADFSNVKINKLISYSNID